MLLIGLVAEGIPRLINAGTPTRAAIRKVAIQATQFANMDKKKDNSNNQDPPDATGSSLTEREKLVEHNEKLHQYIDRVKIQQTPRENFQRLERQYNMSLREAKFGFKSQIQEKTQKIKILEGEISTLKEEKDVLEEKCRATEETLQEKRSEAALLKTEKRNFELTIKHNVGELSRLRDKINRREEYFKKEKNELEENVENLKKKISEITSRNENLEEEIERYGSLLREFGMKIESQETESPNPAISKTGDKKGPIGTDPEEGK